MGFTTDVVASAPILANWGNEIRDRSVQQFASAAERNSQWPSPPTGAVSHLADQPGVLWVYTGSVWRASAVRGVPVAPVFWSGGMTATTSVADVPGASVTYTAIGSRYYRHTITAHALSSALGDVTRITITDNSNSTQSGATWDKVCAAANIADMVSFSWSEAPSAGSVTRKLRVQRQSGTGNVQVFTDATRVGRWIVEEIGGTTT